MMKIISLILVLVSILVSPLSASGFTLEDTYTSDIIDTTFYTYVHEDTGFTVVYAENSIGDNHMSLTFRTPLINDADLTHVFEHTLLSGSEKYPSTSLFADINSGTYITGGNGVTNPACTTYFLSTASEEQLRKYVDAILSLVDSPLLLVDENIYKREAVRYDLFSPDGDISPSGTVFVEDMGYLTVMDRNAIAGAQRALYQGTNASYFVGRLPLNMKDNTYENVVDLFEKYYNWDNALLYISGNLDIEAILDIVEDEHLSVYKKNKTDVREYYDQEVTGGYREEILPVPVVSSRDSSASSALVYAFDISDYSVSDYYVLDILYDMISSSLLYDETRDNGLGNLTMFFNPNAVKPYLCFYLPYASNDMKEEFKDTVERIIRKLSDGYYSQSDISASVDRNIEEASLASASGNGGTYYEDFYKRAFVFFDASNAAREYDEALAELKENGEEMLRMFFSRLLEPERASVLLEAIPDSGEYERIIGEIDSYLADMKSSMSEEEKLALIDETEAFYAWAEKVDVNHDIAIDREDVPYTALDLDVRDTSLNGMDGKLVILDESDLIQLELSFPISDILSEEKELFMLYMHTFLRESSEYDPSELRDRMHSLLPGRNLALEVKDGKPYFTVTISFLRENMEEALDLFYQTMLSSVHTKEYLGYFLPSLIEIYNPHNYNIQDYSRTYGTDYYKLMLTIKNEDLYDYLVDVYASLDEEGYFEKLSAALDDINFRMLSSVRLSFTLFAEEDDIGKVASLSQSFISSLSDEDVKDSSYPLLVPPSGVAFINDSATANLFYCVKLSDIDNLKGSYAPYLVAFAEKCMRPLRTDGTIYSYVVTSAEYGNMLMLMTYSDSDPEKSLGVMRKGWSALGNMDITEEELNAYSLNVLASKRLPYGKLDAGIRKYNLGLYFSQEKAEDLINGAIESSLDEKETATKVFSDAFSSEGVLFYQGPENLLEPIRDNFSLVVDCT